jgi:hypothetical protein
MYIHVEKIFAIPDSHLLAFVQAAKSWIGKREFWRVVPVARQVVSSAWAEVNQS